MTDLEAEPKHRAKRRIEIPKQAAVLREQLGESERQLKTELADDAAPAAQAERLALRARRQALQAELDALGHELAAYEARADLLPLRRDLAAGKLARAEQQLNQWREAAERLRREETESQLRRARREATLADPTFAALAEANARWTERRQEIVQLIARDTADLESSQQKLAHLREQMTRTRQKVDAVGLTNAIGLLLRKQAAALPDLSELRYRIRLRQPIIGDCQMELLELEDRRSELANLDEQVELVVDQVAASRPRFSRSYLAVTARTFLEAEKQYLDALISDVNTYFDQLVDLDNAERQLIEETESYSAYLAERVLWVRSASAFSWSDVGQLGPALGWLARVRGWREVALGWLSDGRRHFVVYLAAVALLAGVLYLRRHVGTQLDAAGETARRPACCRQLPTMQAVLLTCLLASVWPILVWLAGWRLGTAAEGVDFPQAIAAGLTTAAGLALVLQLWGGMCRPNGLFEAHFQWSTATCQHLRRLTVWAMIALLPPTFLAATMSHQGHERYSASLGRLGFVVVMAAAGVLAHRLLRPGGVVFGEIRGGLNPAWVKVIRGLGYPLAVAMPGILALMSLAGYHYTAAQLARRMVVSLLVLLAFILLRSLLLRWVMVRRRKLSIEQARQRREARLAEVEANTDNDGDSESAATANVAEPGIDLAAINSQTRHLVEYSLAVSGMLMLWFTWVDVLPALGILDRVALWGTLDGNGAVTLADLGLAALILATALIAVRNLPGLLELTLLQRIPLDAGIRYTIGTVSRYAITMLGVVLACHAVGLSWHNVQWLVAAIGVGLGFGLQEIFANFVSGLIILFERPIRVGDVVTVDDVTGVVSRVRMRATTITNWDRKEFIVPNKEFITGRLLNWTLSDQVNRIVVKVGIAYGSDTELATRLLYEVATDHPLVLEDPEPMVTFEEFGDSALVFTLRCYLPSMERRLEAIHGLNMAVDARFRRAGIEIAFPQHDVHLRSIDFALPLARATAGAESQPTVQPAPSADDAGLRQPLKGGNPGKPSRHVA